jgi:hypothetical protein
MHSHVCICTYTHTHPHPVFVVQEVEEIKRDRMAYLKDVWNLMDWMNLCVFFAVYAIRITSLVHMSDQDPMLDPGTYVEVCVCSGVGGFI